MSKENIKASLVALNEGNYDKMRTLLKTALTEKAVVKIDEMKIKVAKDYLK